MELQKISFGYLKDYLSHFDYSYSQDPGVFKDFISFSPSVQAFEEAIASRKNFINDRDNLNKIILKGYEKASVTLSERVKANIDSLMLDNSYTVITAHQPCVLGGPFYFVLKITSVIALTNYLNTYYRGRYHFVPTFVIGGEDHDFDEISSVNVFGKQLQWISPTTGGPVGEIGHQGIDKLLEELRDVLGTRNYADKVLELFRRAHDQTNNLADATLYWIDTLFAEYGLVIVNLNGHEAKQKIREVMIDEVQNQSSQRLVQQTQRLLEEKGFKNQAFAREINLYRISDNKRQRLILLADGKIGIDTTDEVYTVDEIVSQIRTTPEVFSPNVILRPILQEAVLPNLAYIGGGGELAYWMERKSQFQHYNIHFPILLRRDSLSWLDENSLKKIQKLDIQPLDLFKDKDLLVKEFLEKNSAVPLNAEIEKNKIAAALQDICNKAESIDPTLGKALMAESVRINKQIEQLESRLLRAEKQKNETSLNQLQNLREKLLPGGNLQERYESFIPLYMATQGEIIPFLVNHLNPLSCRWNILKY